MAEKLGEALLDLDTNDKAFRKGVDGAERLAQGLGRTLDDVSRRAVALGKNLFLGAAAGAAAMGVLVKRAIDTADEMSKAALKAGVSTEALSRLAWAGELSDVSLGALTTSIGRLNNVMAEMARGGATDTKAIFDALGIAVTDADGKLRSGDHVFYELADRFAAMENGAERSALAIQIFGRSGAELVPLLVNGSAGLRDMADEADRLGKTISTQTGRDAEEFNDSLTRLKAVAEGLALTVATDLLPELNRFTNWLNDPSIAAGLSGLASGVIGVFNAIVDAVEVAVDKVGQFFNLIEWAATHDWGTGEVNPDALNARNEARRRGALAAVGGMLGRGETSAPDADFYAGIFGSQPGAPAGTSSAPSVDFSGLFSGAGGGAAAQVDKAKELIATLRAELDTLRETDPVQQRLIGMRTELANATGTQRAEVESLITTIHEETKAWENSQAAAQMFGEFALDSLEGLRKGTKSAIDVLGDLVDMLIRAVAQSALLGQGPLAGIFGTANPKGGTGGLFGMLGNLFSGFFATGGLIPNGTFGIVGERGPEPVIGTPAGARVLPNSSLASVLGGEGSARGPITVHINGSGLGQSELTQAIEDGIRNYDRFQLPQRVAAINADPQARG